MFKPVHLYDDENNYSSGQDYMGYKKIFYPSSPIARQFAEKSRFEFMIDSMDEDMRRSYVNDKQFRYELNKSLGFNQQYDTDILHSDYYKEVPKETNQEERGFWGKVGDFLRGTNYASAGLANGIIDTIQGDEGASIGKAFEQAGLGLKAGINGDERYKYDYGQVLDNLGWKKTDNPEFSITDPSTWKLNNIAHDAVGFVGDVALDPATYLGGLGLIDDTIRGSGKVVKGAVAGSDDIVKTVGKGLGTKSIIKEATEDEAVKIFQKIKGAEYVPSADEIGEFIRRTNDLRGIKQAEPLTFLGKELVSSDVMSKVRTPMQSLSDMTIAPYSQKLIDIVNHSEKFSTKGAIVDLARSNPVALQNTFDFMATAGEHGLTHAKMMDEIGGFTKELSGLDNDTQNLITQILEDKSYYDKLNKTLNKGSDVDKVVDNVNKDNVRELDPVKTINEEINNSSLREVATDTVKNDLTPKINTGEDVILKSNNTETPVKVLQSSIEKDGVNYSIIEKQNGDIMSVRSDELSKSHSITGGHGITENPNYKVTKIENKSDDEILDNIQKLESGNSGSDIVKGYVDKFERPDNSQRVMHNPYQFKEKILHPDEVASKYGINVEQTGMTSGGLVNVNTGEVVDYLKDGSLEKMSLQDIKNIAKGHDIPYLSDFKGLTKRDLSKLDENDLLDLASKYKIKDYDLYTQEGVSKLQNQIIKASREETKGSLISEIRKLYDPYGQIKSAREKIIDDGFDIKDYTKFVPSNALDSAEQALKVDKKAFFNTLTQEGKEKFVADLIDKDPYLNNIFKHLSHNGKLTTQFNANNKTLFNFIDKYLEGDTKWFVNNSHKFHTDYNKALKLVESEFGEYSKLTNKEKALRMDRMWDWFNNPKQMNEAYENISNLKQISGKNITNNISDEYELYKLMNNGSSVGFKESLEDQITKQESRMSDLANGRMNTSRDIDHFDPLDLGSKRSANLIEDDVDKFTAYDIDNGVKKHFKEKNLNQAFSDGKFADDVDYNDIKKLDTMLHNSKQPLPDDLGMKLIESEITGTKISKYDIDVALSDIEHRFNTGRNSGIYGANKAMEESTIGKMEESKKVINTALNEQGIKNTNADEILQAKKLSEEVGNIKANTNHIANELNEIPKEVKPNILNPSDDIKNQVKEINNLPKEQLQTANNVIDLASNVAKKDMKNASKQKQVTKFGTNVVNDEEILNKAVEITDNEKLAFEYAKKIRKTFNQIGKEEIAIGKLNEKKFNDMMNSYVAHIITPESKDLLETLKKTNPDMYNMFKPGNSSNRFSLGRTYKKGAVLPDGYVLKEGSIKEINEHMKQYLNGNNLFADKISDIYMSRMIAHNNLVYDYSVANDMVGKFGTQATKVDRLTKGESAIIKTEDVKKALSKASKEQKAKFYADLGIEEGYFEKTYKPFMKLDGEQFNYFKKSNSIPTYKINNIIVDKAESLAKTQFGTDLNMFLKVYDKFHTLWKTQVTAVRPGFHMRNAQSNVFQNYLDVGVRALDPYFNKKMLDVANGKAGTIRILGKKYTYDEIRAQAVKHNVIDNGFFENEIQELTNPIKALNGKLPSKLNPLNAKEFVVYKAGRELGNKVENQARLANFVANLERGKGFQEAGEHVNKFLFDYGDLTKFEKDVMKRIIPFYTWMRKNVPLQLDQMIEKPGRYLATANVIDHVKYKNDNINRPDYAKDYVALPFKTTDKEGKEYYIMWNDSLPYGDLKKVTTPTEMFGSLSPFIKIPVELALGKNVFFGQDIKDKRMEYLKQQIPGVGETTKLQKATGDMKNVAISDVVLGSGLKGVKEKQDFSKKNYPKETDKLKKVYQIYLYNKKKQEKEKKQNKTATKVKDEDEDIIY